jgi:hypothetical protein
VLTAEDAKVVNMGFGVYGAIFCEFFFCCNLVAVTSAVAGSAVFDAGAGD